MIRLQVTTDCLHRMTLTDDERPFTSHGSGVVDATVGSPVFLGFCQGGRFYFAHLSVRNFELLFVFVHPLSSVLFILALDAAFGNLKGPGQFASCMVVRCCKKTNASC